MAVVAAVVADVADAVADVADAVVDVEVLKMVATKRV